MKSSTPLADREDQQAALSIRVDRSIRTLRELALEKVRDAIQNQYFKPGQRLIERNLCEELGVSRTVVREVLRQLEAEGLVQSGSHQGPIVAIIDDDTTRQIYELRSLLEGHAAAGCARRRRPEDIATMHVALNDIERAFSHRDYREVIEATTRFYQTMFHAAGDTLAWDIVRSLNARINRLRLITISSPNRGEKAPVEMRALLDAVERQDAEAAAQAASEHIKAAQDIALTPPAPPSS